MSKKYLQKTLLPYWGTCHKDSEHWKLFFIRKELNEFSYTAVLKNAKFVKELKSNIENEIFPTNCGSDAYGISYGISCGCEQYFGEKFEELWTYIEMLLYYKILKYQDNGEEVEYKNEEGYLITGYDSWRQYYGISTPEQAAKMSELSDGVIVGSAIMRIIEKYGVACEPYVLEYVQKMIEAIR